MSEAMREIIFSVLIPVYFFGGLAGIGVFILYKLFPDIDEKPGWLDFGLFGEEKTDNPSVTFGDSSLYTREPTCDFDKNEHKKLPVVREHKQAAGGIYTNGKFENPIKDYSTEKRELQEV